jgi:predicted phosphodiesterase
MPSTRAGSESVCAGVRTIHGRSFDFKGEQNLIVKRGRATQNAAVKFAILGDIHGNWEALSVVLRDARAKGVTNYACVGDVVGYNADPIRCLDKLRELRCSLVRGNHDYYCSHGGGALHLNPVAASAIDWTRGQLDAERAGFLGGLRHSRDVEGFTIVHSTLDRADEWGYVLGIAEARASFREQKAALCFNGHTHIPVAFVSRGAIKVSIYEMLTVQPEHRYLVNVGSVGQPRDRDPRAAYVTYDVDSGVIELHRLGYDIRKAQDKIKKAGLPEWLSVRLMFGI